MMHSIFIHFCEPSSSPEESSQDLIKSIILKYFLSDLEELSKDRVVNVRIKLAAVFSDLYDRYDKMDKLITERKTKIKKKQQLQAIMQQTVTYLNNHFY